MPLQPHTPSLHARNGTPRSYKGRAAQPLLQENRPPEASPGAESSPSAPTRVVKRRPSRARILKAQDAELAAQVFAKQVADKASQQGAHEDTKKICLPARQPGRAAPTPPMPAHALGAIAQHRAWRHEALLDELAFSVQQATPGPLGRVKSHHWLRAIQLNADAPDAACRASAQKARKWLERAPALPAAELLPQAYAVLPAFKFPENAISRQLVADGKMRANMRIREMFGSMGFLFVTNTLGMGGFGKFRIAMDLQGERYAVKELRTPASKAFAKGAHSSGKRKTNYTTDSEANKEVHGIRTLATGVELVGEMMWRGKRFVFMNLMKGDALETLRFVPTVARQNALLLALKDVSAQLHVLHTERRCVHRDFKWENVLVGTDGSFHLSDFGLQASFNHGDQYMSPLLAGSYFAPETARRQRGGRVYGPASDIFSVGVGIGLQLLHGEETPFKAQLFANGKLGLGQDSEGYASYQKWWQSILGDNGHVALEKVVPGGPFGDYFAALKQVSAYFTYLTLDALLPPNPKDRNTAAQLHARFSAIVPSPAWEAQIRQDVAQLYDTLAITEATRALATYRKRHAALHGLR